MTGPPNDGGRDLHSRPDANEPNASTNSSRANQVKAFAGIVFQHDDLVEVRAIWPDKGAGIKPRSRWVRASELHSPAVLQWMGALNDEGWGIYVGANPRKARGGKRRDCVAVARTLWVDFDGGETYEAAKLKIAAAGVPPPTLLIVSGHGVHAYWALSQPILDLEAWSRQQKALIAALPGADKSIHDPPRVMRLPGFLNTKPPTAACVLIEAHELRVHSLTDFPVPVPVEPEVAASPAPLTLALGDDEAILRIARSAANATKFELLWSGNAASYTSASEADLALASLLGFYIGPDPARIERFMRMSALRRPKWDRQKTYLANTIAKALKGKTEFYTPRAGAVSIPEHLRMAPTSSGSESPPMNGTTSAAPELDFEVPGLIPLGQREPTSGRLVLDPRRTLPTAKAFIDEFYSHQDGRVLHHYAGEFVQWTGNRYVVIEDEGVRNRVQPWLHRSLSYARVKTKFFLVPFQSNSASINGTLDSVRAYTHIPAETTVPRWLDDSVRPPAIEVVPCKSTNLHVPTGSILPATPLLFTSNALDFDFDANAPEPLQWFAFLEQIFGSDQDSMGMLQEWFGYCLIADTSQQKMLLIVGPRRSGKGTIGRVLRHLLGPGIVVGPTTSSLAGQFGLQPLIGKSTAIVSDARFSGQSLMVVVERLLCISGEDMLTIDRKYLGAVSMKLPTRFIFLTNELPKFTDSSSALVGRFLVLKLTKSFYNNEDRTLSDRLVAELPGILKWALAGLNRLRDRGRFIQPASGAEAISELEELSSPVGAFVAECCEVGPNLRVRVDDLFQAWRRWCEKEARDAVGTKQSFGRNLSSAVPGIVRRRGTDEAFYEGIGLRGIYP